MALSEKVVMRQHTHANPIASEGRQNLRQREILSSAESSNHFITKTHVGGTLKNARQVVAPNGPHSNKSAQQYGNIKALP